MGIELNIRIFYTHLYLFTFYMIIIWLTHFSSILKWCFSIIFTNVYIIMMITFSSTILIVELIALVTSEHGCKLNTKQNSKRKILKSRVLSLPQSHHVFRNIKFPDRYPSCATPSNSLFKSTSPKCLSINATHTLWHSLSLFISQKHVCGGSSNAFQVEFHLPPNSLHAMLWTYFWSSPKWFW